MLQQVFTELHRLTGWHFMVLGAGALPDDQERFESIVSVPDPSSMLVHLHMVVT